MVDESDWLLTGQHRYVKQQSVKLRAYQARAGDDHDHCELCWGKFSNDPRIEERLTQGYVTDDGHWICEGCFADFHVMFEWAVQ